MEKRPVTRKWAPAYETGIVIPPGLDCACGKDCTRIDKHHSHFPETYFEDPPHLKKESSRELAAQFRQSAYNKFWVRVCNHRANIHIPVQKRTRIPKVDVMATFMDEHKLLTNLQVISGSLRFAKRRVMKFDDYIGPRSFEELEERQFRFMEKREDALEEVSKIEIIPYEVVTGALLLVVPELGLARLAEDRNPQLVLPSIWPRKRARKIVRGIPIEKVLAPIQKYS